MGDTRVHAELPDDPVRGCLAHLHRAALRRRRLTSTIDLVYNLSMKSMGISEFKSHCIRILKDLQRSRSPLIITHRGRPLARIEPIDGRGGRVLGALRHLGRIKGDLVHVDFTDEWEMEDR